ncbi:MAG: hypothetical protein CBE00_03325 [Planctomycetaceae bacterium TMED240]|nr:MAG: hypothetical protein CBE00_03325 [Planctomycetaceae bacterium TMED240]
MRPRPGKLLPRSNAVPPALPSLTSRRALAVHSAAVPSPGPASGWMLNNIRFCPCLATASVAQQP